MGIHFPAISIIPGDFDQKFGSRARRRPGGA
jgi:hypothetical protein